MIALRDEESRVVVVRVEQPCIERDRMLEGRRGFRYLPVAGEHLGARDVSHGEPRRELERAQARVTCIVERL